MGYCLNSVKKGPLIYTARTQAGKNDAVILLVAGGSAFNIGCKTKAILRLTSTFFFLFNLKMSALTAWWPQNRSGAFI